MTGSIRLKCELRQPYTPLGITEDTLDETIIINENRQERADHHTLSHVQNCMISLQKQ